MVALSRKSQVLVGQVNASAITKWLPVKQLTLFDCDVIALLKSHTLYVELHAFFLCAQEQLLKYPVNYTALAG